VLDDICRQQGWKQRIPPLRCGMTNERTGNGKAKQILRLRRRMTTKKQGQKQLQMQLEEPRQIQGFFPFDKLRVRMTTLGG
jgi:hypothetical protein